MMRYDIAMGYRDIKGRYFLLARVIVLIALIGLGLLIFTNIGEDPSHVTFSLIAFAISVSALLVTILQSITIARQMQITERAAHDVRETGEQLKALISNDNRLVKEVHEDIELDHDIIDILEEHGVGENEEVRHHVAKRIAQKVHKRK